MYKTISTILYFFSIIILIPSLFIEYYKESIVFGLHGITIAFFAYIYAFFNKNKKKCSVVTYKDSVLLLMYIWIIISLISAIPFYLLINNITIADALFESVSGLTTTGSTIFEDIESLSKPILLWRMLLHLIGGIGILTMTSFLILKFKNEYYHSIQNDFATYYDKENNQNKNFSQQYILSCIASIYFIILIACIATYYFLGMNLFDAVCHGISTIATGGFANYNDSINHFNENKSLICAIIFFMLLSSLPMFNIYRIIALRDKKSLFDEQILYFLLIISISIIALYFFFNLKYRATLLEVTFTITSIFSSTGFVLIDYEKWQYIGSLAVCLSFIGGCLGSTSGGIKILRFIIIFKSTGKNIFNFLHQNKKDNIIINGKITNDETVIYSKGYFILFIITFGISFLIISFLNPNGSFLTNFTAVSATLTNSGPGLGGKIGAIGNYSSLSSSVKFLLSLLMIMGRLEIYPLLFMAMIGYYNMKKIIIND